MAEVRILNEVGATVVINGEERDSVVIDAGSGVTWSVSKDGYITQSGEEEHVWEDTVLPVTLYPLIGELVPARAVTFRVTPQTASLVVDGEEVALALGAVGATYATYTCYRNDGDTVEWGASCAGYIGDGGSFTVEGDMTVEVSLIAQAEVSRLNIAPSYRNFRAAGGTDTYAVDANVAWEVTSKPDWCSVSPTSGDGDATLEVTADNYEDGEESRRGTIRLEGGSLSAEADAVQLVYLRTSPTLNLRNTLMYGVEGTLTNLSTWNERSVSLDGNGAELALGESEGIARGVDYRLTLRYLGTMSQEVRVTSPDYVEVTGDGQELGGGTAAGTWTLRLLENEYTDDYWAIIE